MCYVQQLAALSALSSQAKPAHGIHQHIAVAQCQCMVQKLPVITIPAKLLLAAAAVLHSGSSNMLLNHLSHTFHVYGPSSHADNNLPLVLFSLQAMQCPVQYLMPLQAAQVPVQ
jgi:hypothetical protein